MRHGSRRHAPSERARVRRISSAYTPRRFHDTVLIRSCTRPPFALERIEELKDGAFRT
jgi:hypothetical protein